MRRVAADLIVCFFLSLAILSGASAAQPDKIAPDETPEEPCGRLAPDLFRTVDYYRAAPACTKAMKQHTDETQYALGMAMAYIAGKKQETAEALLQPLIADGNTSAMLVLAYI